MLRLLKRRRVKRQLRAIAADLDHDTAARAMRYLAKRGGTARIVLPFAERARDTAPTPALYRQYERWVKPYREGRRVKFAVFPVTILEPISDELREAVEEAFDEGEL